MKSLKTSNNKTTLILVTIISLAALTIFEILLARYMDINKPEFSIGNLISIYIKKHYYTYGFKLISREKYKTNLITEDIPWIIIVSLIEVYNIIRYNSMKLRSYNIIKYLDTLQIGIILQSFIAHTYQLIRYSYVTDYIVFGNQNWVYDMPDLMQNTAALLTIVIAILRIYYSFKEDKLII